MGDERAGKPAGLQVLNKSHPHGLPSLSAGHDDDGQADDGQGVQNQVIVASYNIHKAVGLDRQRRPDRILDVLAEVDADIVVLQEADRRFGPRLSALPLTMIEDRSQYKPVPVALRPHSLGWHGNAILVKKHVEIIDCDALHLPSIEPRGAVVAQLRVNDIELRVFGLHLDLSGLWRRRQSAAILHHIAVQDRRLPTVMMGDTNEWSRNSGCLRDFGAHHQAVDTGPSFHARMPVARLDRIFVSHELQASSAGVHSSPAARVASDHLPVWARLERT